MTHAERAWLRFVPVVSAVLIVVSVATMCGSGWTKQHPYTDNDFARDAVIAYARRDAR